MNALRVLAASFWLQLSTAARSPGQFMILITAPLFSVIFLSLALSSGRTDLAVNAVLGPGLIGLWFVSLDLAGSIIGQDRWSGRLELLIGAPSSLSLVVLGRILVIVLAGALTFAESWLVALIGFHVAVPVRDPVVFVLGMIVTCFAMAGTATLLAGSFVLSRSLQVFQNTLSYPFYILGGIVVPVTVLPGWLSPVSKLVFLSWSSDVLRDALRESAVDGWLPRLGIVALLGAVALAGGGWLTRAVVRRTRVTGSAAHG